MDDRRKYVWCLDMLELYIYILEVHEDRVHFLRVQLIVVKVVFEMVTVAGGILL